MKVALAIDITRPGGGSHFVPKLYRALEARGHEPVLLSNEDLGVERWVDVPFSYGGSGFRRLLSLPRAAWGLRRALSAEDPDVVVYLSPVAVLAGDTDRPSVYAPRFFVGEEWVLLADGLVERLGNRWVESRAVTRDFDLLVALSRDMESGFREAGARGPVEVVPIGVDTEEFSYSRERPGGVVGFAGAFDDVKGIDYLLDAAEEVAREREVSFLLAGGSAGELDREVEGVEVLGRLSHGEMPGFYRRCDVLAMPSLTEGLPRAALESLACGTPVVASDVGGVSDAVIHGETGLLVEPGDVEGLRDALLRLLDDPETREGMGRSGRELVEERFDGERNRARLVDLLEDVA